ncbi:MAG: DNA polymerase I [Ruminococcaceae bacterium]|nr:DNA polymerase I [Oscillospiraceae bacterium]
MKKLLVIDGNSILNRAFYGVRPLSTKDGIPTNAIFGFINIINKNIEQIEPDFCAVAFDVHAPTFRHKMFSEYKAGRRPMPEELAAQFPYAKKCLEVLGISCTELAGYEADDILGTFAKMASEEGHEAYILTGDRDSLQLIGDRITVLLATNNDSVRFDRAAFFEKYGVQPEQFVDVKALMGDTSDNIPGVPGVGEKTATKLIAEFSSLDGLYEVLPSKSLSAKVNEKLMDNRQSAFMSQELARINCDAPVELTLADIERKEIDRAAAYELFSRLELAGFIKKFGLDAEVLEKTGRIEISELCPTELSQKALLAVGYEDKTLTVCDGHAIYKSSAPDKIKKFFANHKNTVVYDSKKLYKALDGDGIYVRSCGFDIMLAAYIVDSGEGSYELARLLMKFCSTAMSESTLPEQYVYMLYEPVLEALKKCDGEELLFKLEMPTAAVLADMELAGFKIDREAIADFGRRLEERENELAERIYFYAGERFNINSPKQLGTVLFEKLSLPTGKKTKTGYSTNAETLERLAPYHPIIEDILDYREAAKLRSTYVDGLLREADENGRVHTNFKQTGTATGRLSSTEPNLQNIPIKTELGRELRKYFVVSNENYVFIDADYSQIELRILAHISGDEVMQGAFLSGFDIHTATASTVFGVSPEAVTPLMRKRAKAVNFGILYGMGDFRLSNDLGISMKEAKLYIESYLASYPRVASYLEGIKSEARQNGYVKTIMGRRRYIPELAGKNKNLQNFGERVAMNSPIQGSAADIIKLAMLNVDRRLKEEKLDARLLLQVHDELLIESATDCAERAEEILKNEMENAVSLSVPLSVDVTRGENWYE